MRFLRLRPAALRLMIGALFVAAGVLVASDFAEARAGRSMSFGSRGSRTWSTPAPTPTAPSAQPMQRSATPQTQSAQGARAPGMQSGGFFNRGGFMGGLMGGLLGAGIFGLLMGSGFFSGLGSLSGILGLLLQVALIFIVVRLVMGWMRARNQPSYAGGARPDPMARDALNRDAMNGGGAAAPRSGFGTGPRGKPIKLEGADFDAFERTLGEVQAAYSRADKAALATLLTPEMAGYMAEELDEMAREGLENRITDVKLLQGDLSEAWSEGDAEYATVAMRYELKDVTLDKATGRVVQGDPERTEQAVEFWTFARPPRGVWKLSAIQQG
ncbi:TIM44-like domain-containing protein [Ancylobacter dichloromethanicus]|uniref:Membrane protein n=1 Tax=Ancylobacter dichloromethanicus TaxID=518825 RepID=A0A9W6J5V3_9HYPH|nr:TIM44-like domain-containing protein [Ancylobacter dichloromethanicus]MBS7553806.1 TIM44-like domain-containing protein [Ancylobacter dichloromethanicus]GLK70912.1 membrane protein [Ancylobacter dichloromethanicus]